MIAHIYLAAVEDSADALAADVIRELRVSDPDITLSGVGGDQMRKAGVFSGIDTSGLAILGLFDALAAYSRVKRIVGEIADDIEKRRPDAVVLIDSWGVMWRLAREVKRRKIPATCIKLIGPQVWATRPGRAKVLARWCDHLLCIHEFERPYYEGTGLQTTTIGNPAIGRLTSGDASRFRQRHNIQPDAPVVGLLPGSRQAELKRVAPALLAAASQINARHPEAHLVCLPAPSVREQLTEMARSWPFPHILADVSEDRSDVMAAMDVALACSGTITTELAEQGAAVITGYKLGWLSWAIARSFLLQTKFISLINVAAGKEIIPEFVQTRLRPQAIAHAATTLLEDPSTRSRQVAAQHEVIAQLSGAPDTTAAQRAAAKILELASSN